MERHSSNRRRSNVVRSGLLCNFGDCDLLWYFLLLMTWHKKAALAAQGLWQAALSAWRHISSPVSLVNHYQATETLLTPIHTPLLFPPVFCKHLQSIALSGFSLSELPFRHPLLKTAFPVGHKNCFATVLDDYNPSFPFWAGKSHLRLLRAHSDTTCTSKFHQLFF